MTTESPASVLDPDFDGCSRRCRKAGAHTLKYGDCEFAPPPEPPKPQLPITWTGPDGYLAAGWRDITWDEAISHLAPGGKWRTVKGWMNGDRFQTYTSSAEGFLPPTGPTHQQRIWTGPVEPIEQVADELPFGVKVHVSDALPPGRVMAVSRVGTAQDGTPIVSAVAADLDPPEPTP